MNPWAKQKVNWVVLFAFVGTCFVGRRTSVATSTFVVAEAIAAVVERLAGDSGYSWDGFVGRGRDFLATRPFVD